MAATLVEAFSVDGAQWLNFLQWPAFVITVAAGWLVSGTRRAKREVGFWFFLVSNLLWIGWGMHTHASALVLLQFCLGVSNIRGMIKNRSSTD